MAKRAGGVLLPHLGGGAADGSPLHARLYRGLRQAILSGKLVPGARLPSTRTLAADLGVSRTTAEEAFAQLDAEGYLTRRVGDGTYVTVPKDGPLGMPRAARPSGGAPRPSLSLRGRSMARTPACEEPTAVRAFRAGLPALEAFPLEIWQRLLARRLRTSGRGLLGYGEAAGYRPLREAIAAYLGAARAVSCTPDQVIVLSSSQQAVDLAARVLLDAGDTAWMEEPGYLGARLALEAAGARLVPVPVDANGLDVAAGRSRAPRARLAYVTPSHQYPTGVTLPLERRLALLAWAEAAGAWILEDDYDSEFRYAGRPLAAIQGLDRSGRVLYVGTFTKVLYPSLRLAYLVAPRDLAPAFATARTLTDGHAPTLPQAVLADFMAEGHFAAHVRRVRGVYRERRDALLDAARRHLPEDVRLGPADAGLHVTARLPQGFDDRALAARAPSVGLELLPLSRYYLGPAREPGLVLGYGGLSPAAIRHGVRTLARLL